METRVLALVLVGAASIPMRAMAQDTLETSREEPGDSTDPGPLDAVDESTTGAPTPPTPMPTEQPSPVGAVPPPPNVQQHQAQQAPSVSPTLPTGQWVYTQQYGWVYAPYDQTYTYVDPNATYAQAYIYRPTMGWGWYISPWIISIGPRPYWGAWGPGRYAWYAHPWFRARSYSGGPAYYGGHWGGPHYSYTPRRWAPAPYHAHPRGPLGPRRR